MTTRIREAMTTKDNQMKNPEDVIEPRSEYGNLPPELRALKGAMDMVFNAVTNAAPQEPASARTGNDAPSADGTSGRGLAQPAGAAPRRMDIEKAIMRAPGFDYLLASEIFAALQRRLQLRYQNLNPQVEEAMQRLSRAFDHAA